MEAKLALIAGNNQMRRLFAVAGHLDTTLRVRDKYFSHYTR